MTSEILLMGDGRIRKRRTKTQETDSRRRASQSVWHGSWCQPASVLLAVHLLLGSFFVVVVVHGHIPSMSKTHLFPRPPSTSPSLPSAMTVPHLASATSAFVGESNDPLYAQEVVVSEEEDEEAALLSSNNNNNIHVPAQVRNSKGSSLVNSGLSNQHQQGWKINFGDVVVADGKTNANQGDTADVLSMVPTGMRQMSPARPARPLPASRLLVTSSLHSELSNLQNVTIISTNTISVPIAKNKLNSTPKMRNNNKAAPRLRAIGISLPPVEPPPTTEEEEEEKPPSETPSLNLVPVYPVPHTEVVSTSKESETMPKVGLLNLLVTTTTAATPPLAATVGRLEKQLETFADAQMHIQVAPMRTRLPRSHALKALAISFNTGFKATDDDTNHDAAINGQRSRPVIDLPDSALTSSEETTTPVPLQQTPAPVPTVPSSHHVISTNTEQPSTSYSLWPAAMRPRLSSLIVPPNDEIRNELEGTSSTSVSCKRSTTNKKKKKKTSSKNKLCAGSGSKGELSKSIEALSPSNPESRDVTTNKEEDDDDDESEEKLSTTAVTSQEKQETSIHEEDEKPATHPPNYFKRLSAGDRGVLDDQNRHLPQMKEEDIDAWFRINEKHWTHAATIVYHHAGQKISMFTKQKPEKPTRKKSSKKSKNNKKKKKNRREPSNKNKFIVLRSGDRR